MIRLEQELQQAEKQDKACQKLVRRLIKIKDWFY